MNKKCLGSSIGIVLLIGLTAALASIIFTFGLGFTEKTKSATEYDAQGALACTDVRFVINGITCSDDKNKIADVYLDSASLRSDSDTDIGGFVFRVYDSSEKVSVDYEHI